MVGTLRAVELRVPSILELGSLLAFEAELERAPVHGAIVLLGAPQTFCAGFDLAALCECSDDAVERTVHTFARCLMRLRRLPRPTIAVVEGDATGSGVGIVAACDVVLATPTATFALPEVLFGLRPAIIEPILRERVRAARLRQLVLRGTPLVACAAVDIGLADKVVEPSSMPRVIRHEIRSLSAGSGSVVAATKAAPGLADAIALGAADTLQRLRDGDLRRVIRHLASRGAPPNASA